MRKLFYLATGFLCTLSACSQPNERTEVNEGPVTIEVVSRVLEVGSESAIVDVLNRAKEEAAKNEELANYLVAKWESEPSLESRVLIVLADAVAQLALNGIVQVDVQAVHDYLRETARSSSDATVTRRAASALALFDSEEDVAILEGLATDNNSVTMRAAVSALAAMCNDEADTALMRLSDSENAEVRSFASETKLEFDTYKQNSEWCNR